VTESVQVCAAPFGQVVELGQCLVEVVSLL